MFPRQGIVEYRVWATRCANTVQGKEQRLRHHATK